MLELKIDKKVEPFLVKSKEIKNFKEPLVFFMKHKNDNRNIFITFIVMDFQRKELTYLLTYNDHNINIINELENSEKYKVLLTPHNVVKTNEKDEFLVFFQEEASFLKVNYEKDIVTVYFADELFPNDNIDKISSTFYKDEDDQSYFYMSAIDRFNTVHIYRVSISLNSVEKIDSFISKSEEPPHTIRKYNNLLFISNEFLSGNYEMVKKGKVANSREFGMILTTILTRLIANNSLNMDEKELGKQLMRRMKEKYEIKCVPGRIMTYDVHTKEKKEFFTSGGCPAHFEIDTNEDTVYTSSHNFFCTLSTVSLFAPAVIDKYKIIDGDLNFVGSFQYSKGFRYASHRVFKYNGKPYICTVGWPNRLIFADATSMDLLYYEDIDGNIVDEFEEGAYIHTWAEDRFFAAIEVSENGEDIIIIAPKCIYLYNFAKRSLIEKINYRTPNIEGLIDNLLATIHINYM